MIGMGLGVALKDGCVERMGCGFKGWGVGLKYGVWLYRDEVWLSNGGGLQVVLDQWRLIIIISITDEFSHDSGLRLHLLGGGGGEEGGDGEGAGDEAGEDGAEDPGGPDRMVSGCGHTISRLSMGTNSLIFSKRYSNRLRGRPGGGITAGSTSANGFQFLCCFRRTSKTVSLPSVSILTVTLPGLVSSNTRWWKDFIPSKVFLMKMGSKKDAQLY